MVAKQARYGIFSALTLAIIFLLLACGGGGGGDDSSVTISLSAAGDSIPADGASSVAVTATIVEANGQPVAIGTGVSFSTTLGSIGGGGSHKTLDDSGVVTVSLIAGETPGSAEVTCSARGVTQKITVQFTPSVAGGPPYGAHLGLAPNLLNIAGLKYVGLEDAITMRVSDQDFNEVPDGTQVSFTTDFGLIKSGEEEVPTTDSAAVSTLISTTPFPPDGFVTPATATMGGGNARVLCMSIDPVDSDIIYLGTDGGGVFKTDDGGQDWFEKGVPQRGFTNGMVWDLAVDPDNQAVVYAATDEGLFRSTGSGDDWEKISRNKHVTGEFLGKLDLEDLDLDGYSDEAYTLAYDSDGIRPKTQVYLNGVETLQYRYFSADTISFIVKDLAGHGGDSITIDYWTETVFPPLYPVRAVALGPLPTGGAPVDDRVLYAGTLGKGIYKSEDGGFSWAAKNQSLSDQDVLTLAIDPTFPNIIYAGTQGGGVFKSTDAAESWAAVNTGLPASVIHDIRIDPNTPSRIYAATNENGVYYSTDGGESWNKPATNIDSHPVTKLALDDTVVPALEIYAATEGDGIDPVGGVYKSSDGGRNWTRLTALAENHAHALGIVPGDPDTLYAGARGRNVFKSDDGGSSWSTVNGTAPDALTNDIFATTRVLFSGDTLIRIVQVDTGGQGAGGLEYYNDAGSRGVIYHGTAAGFLFSVQDENGNPLIGGTDIKVTAEDGTLSGETEEILPDRLDNRNYAIAWENDITDDENQTVALTVEVTSEGTTDLPGNGNLSLSLTRTLIRPVAFDFSPAKPEWGDAITVTPRGGSETTDTTGSVNDRGGYTVLHRRPDGTSESKAVSYGGSAVFASMGTREGEGLIRVTDDITGEYVEQTYEVDEPEPTIDSFTASPTELPAGGGTVTLSWTVTGAASASIDQGVGSIAGSLPSGSRSVGVSRDTTFTLTAANSSGETVTAVVSVTVAETDVAAPVINSFSSSEEEIDLGDSFTMTWNITGADTAVVDQGIGALPTTDAGTMVVTPTTTGDLTYTLTATNAVGTDTASFTITVNP